MDFEITHSTLYTYGQPAAEAYGEARLTPPDLPTQQLISHEITIDPETTASRYIDHFGNAVDFFSLPYRHHKLSVVNRIVVRTQAPVLPMENLELSVQETRQIFSSALPAIFEYLQPTPIVEIGNTAVQWARKYLAGGTSLYEGLDNLNNAIFSHFIYKKGATDFSTTLAEVWKGGKGVCQDFAHVALSVLRTAGLPSRYVCGYIETDPPKDGTKKLIGAIATHAWVEVLVPGMRWVALDPTNKQWINERYVTVSYGRDASDASPLRGTFKGSGGQKMTVKVFMKRRAEKLEKAKL